MDSGGEGERREFSRHVIDLPVRCDGAGGALQEARIIDLTVKGAAILCSGRREEGALMTLRFTLPIALTGRQLRLSALVIHNFPARISGQAQDGEDYVVGLRFVSLSANDTDLIQRFLSREDE